MDITRKFEDLGVDAIVGTRLMSVLKLTPNDFLYPEKFMKLKDVIGYFKDVPDFERVVNRITVGKMVDRLDHVWGYAELNNQLSKAKAKQQDALFKARLIDDKDEFRKLESKSELNMIDSEVDHLQKEIAIYEK